MSFLQDQADLKIAGSTIVTAPDFGDITRSAKPDDDSDEADDIAAVVQYDDAAEDDMDVSTVTAMREPIKSTRMSIPVSQPGSISDPERRSRKVRKEMSRHEDIHSAPAADNKQSLVPQQYVDMSMHPPLVIPDWMSWSRHPTMLSKQDHMPQPGMTPHHAHEIFSPVHWTGPNDGGMDVSSQFNNYCMISPSHMVGPDGQPPYMHNCFSDSPRQQYAMMSHPHFTRHPDFPNEVHSHRNVPPYGSFMMQPPVAHEIGPDGYYTA